jgi:uncharacterized delta-60 repeat protein
VAAFPAAGGGNPSSGNLDPSFGTDGTAWIPYPTEATNYAHVSGSVLQADGKIVFVGDCSQGVGWTPGPTEVLVARLTSDGKPDSSFGAVGDVVRQLGLGVTPSSTADSVTFQPDGKIVIGGWATDALGNRVFMVSRLNADGSFDSTFGAAGTVTTSSLGGVGALALQPDGKVIAVGVGFIARLYPNGSFDSSFGAGGVHTVTATFNAVALQPDGKIVAAGLTNDSRDNRALFVTRLDAAGSLDQSFGSNGIVLDQLGVGANPNSWAAAAVLQPDGKVVVGGGRTDSNGNDEVLVVRLHSSGDLDSSFGSGGTVIAQLSASGGYPHSVVEALALQPNGKILAAGEESAYLTPDNLELANVLRLNANGSFDTAFGAQGVVLAMFSAYSSQFTTLALQPNGKVITAGWGVYHTGTSTVADRLIVDLPPIAAFISSPDPAIAGRPVAFSSAGSNETDGTITGYAWSFGDGSTASESEPAHTYRRPGSYTVTLMITDDYGFTDSVSHTIRVVRPQAPVLTLARLRPHAFAAAARGASIARRGGTTVSYRDSLAARTRFTVNRILAGKVRGPVRGSFTHHDRRGTNSFHFTGRVGSQRLHPGSYRLNAAPIADGRTGTTVHITFRITR